MRKVLCILLSLTLVLTSGILTYAKGNDKGSKDQKKFEHKMKEKEKEKEKEKKKEKEKEQKEKSVTASVYDTEKFLKDEIKKASKNLENMKKLLKDLQSLKKKHNKDKTMIFINGEEIDTEDAPPVIKYGRTLVPLRAISKGLKANVTWNSDTKTVTVTKSVYSEVYGKKDMTVEIVIGASTIKVDGASVGIEVPATVISNRTFVPIRLIGEIFKMKFDWDSESKTVIIIENHTVINVTTAPVATPTPSSTGTPTPTASVSGTPTVTPLPTATPTPTAVVTPTATVTPAPTATTAATATPTSTPVATPTPTSAA